MRRLAARAGLAAPSRQQLLEPLEQRTLLAGDHPSLPSGPTPWGATAITLDLSSLPDQPALGRGSQLGQITSGDPGDLFQFVMPTIAQGGRARDFVTVLADTGPSSEATKLDSLVEVYDQNGTLITTGANNVGASIGVTTDPTRARTPDGWAGFEGIAGQTYYIRVRADSTIGAGRTNVGAYTLRIDTISITLAVNTTSPDPAVFGTARETTTLAFEQDDVVFRFETGSDPSFTGVASLQAVSLDTTNPALNPRFQLFSTGTTAGVVTPLIADSDSGRQTDAFAVYPVTASTAYYIRVGGDDFRTATDVRPGDPPRQAIGSFTAFVRTAATNLPIDPVTRLGDTPDPVDIIGPDLFPGAPQDGTGLRLFRFTSQGTGEGYITVIGGGLVDGDGLLRPAVRLYDASGRSIDFDRAAVNSTAIIVTPLLGGETYFVVVEGFDSEAAGGTRDGAIRLFVEAHHTFDPTPGQAVDDHINTPGVPELVQWENATPLRFGDPQRVQEVWNPGNDPALSTERNDHSFIQSASGRGRINRFGDTDLFQFTAPVSQLSDYPGDTALNTPALYVGGNFANAGRDPITGQPVKRNNVAIWDAGGWFDTGPRDIVTNGGVPLDGPLDGPVYSQTLWDPDGSGPYGQILVAVGEFSNVYAPLDTPGGLVFQTVPANVAFRVLYPPANRYIWATTIGFRQIPGSNPARFTTVTDPIGFIGGPIFSAATLDVVPNIPGQTGASADELFLGGGFDVPDIDPFTPGNQRAAGLLRISFQPNPADLFQGALVFDNMGGGVTRAGGLGGIVRSLQVYDPPTPALPTNPAPMPAIMPAQPDMPVGLYIGGLFDTADQPDGIGAPATITASNIVRYGLRQSGTATPNPANMYFPLGHRLGETAGPAMGMPTDPGPFPADQGVTASGAGTTGGVYTMTVIDVAGQELEDPAPYNQPMAMNRALRDVPARLYIGGSFTRNTLEGTANNIVSYDGLFRIVGNTPDATMGVVNWQGIVRTIIGYRRTTNNQTTGPDTQLVVGADGGPIPTGQQFPNTGQVWIWQGQSGGQMAWTQVAATGGGTVLSLAVVEENEAATNAPFEQLYIGGSFTQVTGPNGTLTNTSRIARFAVFTGQQPPWAEDWSPLFSPPGTEPAGEPLGLNGLSDPPPNNQLSTAVFSLQPFNDYAPNAFRRNSRQGSRVQITVNREEDSQELIDLQLRVYDSNFALLYTNQSIAMNAPDPAGAQNPGFFDVPGNTQFIMPETWGGEVYYLEISSVGNIFGRYTLDVTTEALPPKDISAAQDGVYIDTFSTYTRPVGERQWEDAPFIPVDGLGFGRNHFFLAGGIGPHAPGRTPNPLNPNAPFDPVYADAYSKRYFVPDVSGRVRYQFDDTPNLANANEVHLYQFRATNDGTAEIRLATKGIVAGWQEQLIDEDDQGRPLVNSNLKAKTINSPLHGAIRIFTNDRSTGQFVQTGFSDGNFGVRGQLDTIPHHNAGLPYVPADGTDRTFGHRDPRIVLRVERGNTYFVQVESAYRPTLAVNPNLVDWRFATGRYDLLIKTTPSFFGVDDHPNLLAGVIPTQFDDTALVVSPRTGLGSISGEIRNVTTGPIQNLIDSDVFRYIADNRGQVSINLTPTSPNLIPRIEVFGLDLSRAATGTGALPGQPVSVSFNAEQGQVFYIAASGVNLTQGTYQLSLAAQGITDDQPFSTATDTDNAAPLVGWANVTSLSLNRFLGSYGLANPTTGAISDVVGTIENPDDRDLFKFTAEAYELAVITVSRISQTLDPFVEVFEVSRDNNGREVFLLIANNNDGQSNAPNAQTSFSTTPGRTYYVVVSGANLDTDFGQYGLNINVAPTDDHPNRSDFPSGTLITLAFDAINFTSTGTANGRVERSTDDDFFRFIAPADGSATITFSRRNASALAGDLTIIDQNDQPFPSSRVTYTTGAGGTITAFLTGVSANTQYFVRVRPGTPAPGESSTGDFSVSVRTDPVDDYPNAGEFGLAANIPLSSLSGVGNITGVLVPTGDSDLFRFTTLVSGTVTVRITTPGSALEPRLALFDAATNQLVALDGNGDSATATITVTAGQLFYVLATAVTSPSAPASAVGTYAISVTNVQGGGGGGGGGGTDDFPNAGEWNDASLIVLDSTTGRGQVNANINFAGDTDLFRFTPAASGLVDILMTVPQGGQVDGTIEIYDNNRVLIFSDSQGVSGTTASISFNAAAGQNYFLLVRPSGPATGSYTVRLAATPLQTVAYFPEGFRGGSVNEFVVLVNPNNVAVTWSLFARYELGDNPDVPIATGTVAPNGRGGTEITRSDNPAGSLVRNGVAYALELRSSLPLGATFSHFDFSAALGESFATETSTTWTFAEVHKDRNNFRDFLLFYNPASTPANITLDFFYTDGTTAQISAVIDARRRGGINIDDTALPKEGTFGVRVTSSIPIVSSLSSYNLTRSGGDAQLGDPTGGGLRGALPGVRSRDGVVSNFSILNTNTIPATVNFVASYARIDQPPIVRSITIPARSSFTQSFESLGLLAGQNAGVTYTSDLPVTLGVFEYQDGDANWTNTATVAARGFSFADLFLEPAQAGINYRQRLSLFNPTNQAIDVVPTYYFSNTTPVAAAPIRIEPNSFTFIQLDQQPTVLSAPQVNSGVAYSLKLDASQPFVASVLNYNLLLAGGWSSLGQPTGLTIPLSSIT